MAKIMLEHNQEGYFTFGTRAKIISAFVGITLFVAAIFLFLSSSSMYELTEKAISSHFAVQQQVLDHHLDGLSQQDIDQALTTVNPDTMKQLAHILILDSDNKYQIVYSAHSPLSTSLFDQLHGETFPHRYIADNGDFYLLRSPIGDRVAIVVWNTDSIKQSLQRHSPKLIVAFLLVVFAAVVGGIVCTRLLNKEIFNYNKQLRYSSLHDSYTQLKNQKYLQESFNHYKQAQRELDNHDFHGVFIHIDIDRLKEINHALGKDVGDEILLQLAKRIEGVAQDQGTTYRLSSDDFIVWLQDADVEQGKQLAFNILYSCREPLDINRSSLAVGVSAGIAMYPEHGTNCNQLIRHAETATNTAKRQRLGVKVFEAAISPSLTSQIVLRSDLNRALRNNEFELYFQPKVKLGSGEMAGVEAMIRWHHPTQGTLGPDEFMRLVEQSGFVHAFTRYVLSGAARQAKVWLDQGYSIPVAVNLSAYNLLDEHLIDDLTHTLNEHQCPNELIEIELTESATMADISRSKHTLDALVEIGIKTTIDDFGTGMSSFAYLKDFNVHQVKIDRSFLTNAVEESRDCRIVEGIINMCHSMGITVVCEGIENLAQAQLLNRLGCDYGQGYFFGKPQTSEQLNVSGVCTLHS